ncbi:MAG TPA: hypothetical protein VH302_06290 [Bryobacteraceae bacterium]|jgi:hypothetical protein|nr:hypothetical protein [Bryobacteraceae bacterium]
MNSWRSVESLCFFHLPLFSRPATRAYKTDFEVHYGLADDPAKSKVDVYIGLANKK